MPGQPVELGPFIGGIGNRTDDSTIEDNEVVSAVNFMVAVDGTLIERPAISVLTPTGLETVFADNFIRADGDVGTSSSSDLWEVTGDPQIISNELSLLEDEACFFDTGEENVIITVTWTGGDGGGLMVRREDSTHFIYIGNSFLVVVDDGTWALADIGFASNFNESIEDGDTMRVVARGDRIKVYKNQDIVFNDIISDYNTATEYGFISLAPTDAILPWPTNMTFGNYSVTSYAGAPETDVKMRLLGWANIYDSGDSQQFHFTANDDGLWAWTDNDWDIAFLDQQSYECFVTYGNQDNFVFFPAPLSGSSGGLVLTGHTLDDDNLADAPRGFTACLHKDRIWVAGAPNFPNRLYYSKIAPDGANADWTNPDAGFVDVNPGDGQQIQYIISYEDSVYIFKQDSTYILSFDAVITQGNLQAMSQRIGANNRDCVSLYQEMAFVYHDGEVFSLVGGQYQSICNRFLPSGDSSQAGDFDNTLALSTFSDYLILRHYDKVLCYSFLVGAWTEWQSGYNISRLIEEPTSVGPDNLSFWAESAVSDEDSIYLLNLNPNTSLDGTADEPLLTLISKTYDFGTSWNFKRMFWWGVDLEAGGAALSVRVLPVNDVFAIRWSDIEGQLWSFYETTTWDALIGTQPFIPDSVTQTGGGQTNTTKRRLVKMLKGLRFHQIQFRVDIDTATVDDPPNVVKQAKLFKLIPMVNIKEGVVAKST